MTKNEKILLQLLIAIGMVGLSFLYLFMPAVRRKASLIQEREEVEMQAAQVRTIVNLTGLEEALEEEKAEAEKNYDYFYSKLNSYTVDDIINGLVTDSGLEVRSLSIGSYNAIKADALDRGQELPDFEEDESLEDIDFLLGCPVNLTVRGSYGQVLELVDRLERESTCIEVTSLSLTRDQRNVVEEEPVDASLILLIYGIDKTVEEDA